MGVITMEIKALTESGSTIQRECDNLQEFVDFLEVMDFELHEVKELERIDV